ncbi:MAG: hypothetical protein HQ595_01060, partial [Candidatus Omnitrophica bacterium]|nr:hypothetical protein [Candidatus Omnitrophota bacterium]
MNFKTKLALLKGIITKRVPLYVQFAVSKHCNLNCATCRTVEARNEERELNLSEINRLAEVLNKLGA